MSRTPKRRSAPPLYVNLHGKPIDLHELRRSASAPVAPPPPEPEAELAEADVETVFDAMCLAGTERGKAWLVQFLRQLAWAHSRGAPFQPHEVATAARRLVAQARATAPAGAGFDVPEAAREAWLRSRLTPALAARAWRAWAGASAGYPSAERVPRPSYHSPRECIAHARLVLYAGLDGAGFEQVRREVLGLAGEPAILAEAALKPFIAELFAGIDRALRDAWLQDWLRTFETDNPIWQPLLAWLDAQVAQTPGEQLPGLRLAVALRRLQRADLAGADAALRGLEGHGVALARATALAVQGQWAAAIAAFAEALKRAGAEARARRGLAASALMRWYVLAHLAQHDPAAWAAARKICVAESGSRKPSPHESWGLWAHAIAVRLGDEPLDPSALAWRSGWQGAVDPALADRLIVAAWLGHAPPGWGEAHVAALVRHLHAIGQACRADLVRQAAARLGWPVPPHAPQDGPPWPVAFFGAPSEAWRDALAAIAALGELRADAAPGAAVPSLVWCLILDEVGRVIDVQPFERSIGPRGPGKAKAVSLAKLKKTARLDPRDAAVVRCIAPTVYSRTQLGIDVAAAAVALVNHPAVVLDDVQDAPVELREALPELEVRRTAVEDGPDVFVFHLADPIGPAGEPALGERWTSSQVETERERRNAIRIVRDGPDRARLIRITPAQRRVAELVSQRWAVPVDAKAELDAALRVLAGHFQLLSDAEAGQAVPCDARLRAQLVPRGEALQLRLVVRPFGDFGPTLQPGHGRPRLITVHDGLNVSTQRDLAAETAQLAQVVEAIPFLAGGEGGHSGDGGDASWSLEDPEQALTVLEILPQLPVVAALEWPRGKPVRVLPVAAQALDVKVSTGRDWLAVDGELRVDEGRVIGLQRLLEMLDESRRGRFVALGQGDYLALTERLRAQLADLQALARTERGELRLPAAAAAFLAEALDGTAIDSDAPWRARLIRLEEAAALTPEPPPGLQAELRGYQAEGYAWLARLAHAGLGAILADDMGLGKTVQTLALLIARAGLGPALVIAPTSVCSNWVDEAARFAPGLKVQLFGDGDRSEMLGSCGPGDLIVASYGLTLIEGEAFAARTWATLVLDEAQALKNAATKRARAIAALQADFRLALSGTPVENRLADLWSIMNLINPGLLGSAGQFAERFVAPIERQRDEAVRTRLRRLVAPFLLRRTKAQVLADLPPRTEIVLRVEPAAEERAFLEAARRSAIDRVAQAGEGAGAPQAAFHVLAELMRLRRAACDPRLVAPELGIVGAKVQEFEQLALELVAGRHKALVFSQFTDFLDLLAARLDAAGVRYQMLTGSTPAAERARRVAAFQAGMGDLFLISLKAGGFGLNLTAADYVIIVDPWWNPAAEDQASGRAHRIGQQRPVTVYRLVTAGSIEERIIELHRDKRDLADGILAGQDQGRPIGAEELRDLLRGA